MYVKHHKGFTLVEALFSLSVLLSVYCIVYSLMTTIISTSSRIENNQYYLNMTDIMDQQFFPVTDLESTLEEIIDDE